MAPPPPEAIVTPDAPHTADLEDQGPDQRSYPRPGAEGVHELRPQSGSRCPSGPGRPPGDTPDPAARGLLRVAELWRFLRTEADQIDEVVRELPEMSGYENRLRGVAKRLRERADDLAT